MFVYNANYNILMLGTDSNLESHSIEINKAFSSISHYNVYEEIEKKEKQNFGLKIKKINFLEKIKKVYFLL